MVFFLGRFNFPRSLSDMNIAKRLSASFLLLTSLKLRDTHCLWSSKNSSNHRPHGLGTPTGQTIDRLPSHSTPLTTTLPYLSPSDLLPLHCLKYLRNLTAIRSPSFQQKRQQAESGTAPSTVASCCPISQAYIFSVCPRLWYVLPYLLNIVKCFCLLFFLCITTIFLIRLLLFASRQSLQLPQGY